MTRRNTSLEIGQRLAAARLQRGLLQADVARSAGLAPSYLSRIESGKIRPTFPTVMRIVAALDADLVEVVGADATRAHRAQSCPVTPRGQCLLDLIRPEGDAEHYTPREVRLLRTFATWLKRAEPGRVQAFELLLGDLMDAADATSRTPAGGKRA